MHRGIAPVKVMHDEYRKVVVYILYFACMFFDCPGIDIHMKITSLKSP